MLAFKHNSGGFGTPGTPASYVETSGGPISLHTAIRPTFATTLADKGIHPSTAQKMLGHSDIRITLAIYAHATDDMQDAATAALESAFS